VSLEQTAQGDCIRIETEAIIQCEPQAVFAVHSDFRQRPLWHDHVRSSELLTGEPIGVGSRFRTTNKTGRMTITTREHITVFEPPHSYCYEINNPFLQITSCQQFAAVAEGTHYQIHIEMKARNWLGKILLPNIARQQLPHFVEAAQELKRYMENQPGSHSVG
jgi:Polyketide cyclase / dehydrase and lipid transport